MCTCEHGSEERSSVLGLSILLSCFAFPQVSRAMRNRGVELFLLPPSATDTQHTQQQPAAAPAADPHAAAFAALVSAADAGGALAAAARLVASNEGAAAGGPGLLCALATLHVDVAAVCERAHRRPPSLADSAAWMRLARSMVERGWPLRTALTDAWELVSVWTLCILLCAYCTIPSMTSRGSLCYRRGE